jgi:alpha-tubulin suppressor-like RCC1 family protein
VFSTRPLQSGVAVLLSVLGLAGGLAEDKNLPLEGGAPTHGTVAVRQLAGGGYSAYALGVNGTVWAWGDNLEGQLGNGSASAGVDVPVRVPEMSRAVALAASFNAAYALQRDGTVWAWGDNADGELGNAGPTTRHLPVRVQRLGRMAQIAAGGFSAYALGANGTVWAWGDNASGQLAESLLVTSSATPLEVKGLAGVQQLTAGGSTAYALARDGTIWAWGDNAFGEMAQPATRVVSVAPAHIARLGHVSAIAASTYTAFALSREGAVWAWGDNSSGQLGDGTKERSYLPVHVRDLRHVISIAAGGNAAYALEADGSVWAWGYGAYGQLGDASTFSSDVPVRVNL